MDDMDDKDIVIDEIDDAGTIILGDEDTTDVAYPKIIKVERTQFSIFEIKR